MGARCVTACHCSLVPDNVPACLYAYRFPILVPLLQYFNHGQRFFCCCHCCPVAQYTRLLLPCLVAWPALPSTARLKIMLLTAALHDQLLWCQSARVTVIVARSHCCGGLVCVFPGVVFIGHSQPSRTFALLLPSRPVLN